MWDEAMLESEAYNAWLDAEWNRVVDEAVAQRRQEAEMAAQEVPVPDDNEIPF